jgi:K+-transporting ATPase KdpF subunit
MRPAPPVAPAPRISGLPWGKVLVRIPALGGSNAAPRGPVPGDPMSFDAAFMTVFVAVGVLLCVYLLYAMLNPEKF